ncbi:Armadillo-like helical [Pyrenophora seminiperda CCB06]|uniref:Armadillo-like helical n=1 Tax=Pyrenophora seminiperda CCB06 TaxID=1302712 RepID=A0A3M7LWG8_9PLEO|nr:Armadillo-like helical [Pyrenophora seminiperda CCB06]
MASKIPDHWLWIGLGVFTFLAIKRVSHGLSTIRTLTEIRNPANLPSAQHTIPSSAGNSPTHQEDAIKTSSLLTLATSHNSDIRLSATKILCNRFYASKTAKDLLIRDLYSKDDGVVHRAQLAFSLLCDMGVWREASYALRTGGSGWTVIERQSLAAGLGGASERDVRRRRREAMVISDDDVWMRDQDDEDESQDLDMQLVIEM